MFKISELFNVELSVLLGGDNPKLHIYSIVRNGKGLKLERRQQYIYESLAYNFIHKKAEVFLVTIDPKPGSMGKPTPGYDMDIVDESGNSCEIGNEGEIVIYTSVRKPAGMFKGYYRDDELTKSVWSDGVYKTGDMAWCDEDGYFWFVGRSDDIIKSSGYRIGPFEVESALIEHPTVLECAVTAVPDPDRGQIVKVTVVLTRNYHPSEELAKELQEHVKKVTAPYKYPRIVEFVAELPKTISGKIRRVQIREKEG